MTTQFLKIGLVGKYTNPEARSTLASLVSFLQSKKIEIVMEPASAQLMPDLLIKPLAREALATFCDLIIVVGGDGSLLDVARSLVNHHIPIVGVNRGRRGFLTDISPQALTQSLEPILRGEFQKEQRFLIEMQLWRHQHLLHTGIALNDIVLYSGDVARMIDFQVHINDQFVYRQRSDGLITATPTGSTAYALAGGGPILHPTLDAIVLVPMYPAVLSSRPIVIDSYSKIELHLMPDNSFNPRLSCDGQVHFDIHPDDKVIIKRKKQELCLLHPLDYDYYYTLRSKLGWTA